MLPEKVDERKGFAFQEPELNGELMGKVFRPLYNEQLRNYINAFYVIHHIEYRKAYNCFTNKLIFMYITITIVLENTIVFLNT